MKNYTETVTFKNKIDHLKEQNVPKEIIKKYTLVMSKFDENGCDIGTDYSSVILAFHHPIS